MARLLLMAQDEPGPDRDDDVGGDTLGEHADGAAPASTLRITRPAERPGFFRWAHEQLAGTPSEVPTAEIRVLEQRLLDALREGDVERALMLASSLLYSSPSHAVAWRIKTRCAQAMRGAVPGFVRFAGTVRMSVRWESLAGTNLPRTAAFMLCLVDGRATVEQLLDMSSLPLLTAYDALDTLARDGVIEVG